MNKGIIITIDGPAGVGKSTVAKELAKSLSLLYLDTGAMYRALALAIERQSTDIRDPTQLDKLLSDTEIQILNDDDKNAVVMLNNDDVSALIRTESISKLASDIATIKTVREALVSIQRKIGLNRNIVAEGRDMGTRVFPDADYKFYLDANPHERALRRYAQIKESGDEIELKTVETELKSRDKRDRTRSESPLHPAPNAVIIDTTEIAANAVIDKIIDTIKSRELAD